MIKPRLVIVISETGVIGMYGNQKIDVQVIDHNEMINHHGDKDAIKESIDKRELDYISNDAELDNVISQEVSKYFD